MSHNKEAKLLKVAENILGLNSAMRFAAILDSKGNIVTSIENTSPEGCKNPTNSDMSAAHR